MHTIYALYVHMYVYMCIFLHRLLALQSFSPSMMMLFVRHVLTVPASMLHLHISSPEVRMYVHM